MKIAKKDIKHGVISLEINSLDDLWYLSQIVDPNDIVTSKTTRKIKLGDDASKVVKKTYVLSILVEKVEYETEVLRINGKVDSDVEDIPKGSYHSISLEIGSWVSIKKEEWLQYQLQRIDDASKDVPKVLLAAVDRGDVSFGVLKQFGVEVLSEISGSSAKKQMKEDIREDFFGIVAKELISYAERLNPEYIIVGSPAFWKDEIFDRVKKLNQSISKKVITATTSSVGKAGLQELVKRDEVRDVLQKDRVVQETRLVEELLKEIHRDGNSAYGINLVESAAHAGAVKNLLVTEHFLSSSREDNSFDRLDQVMKAVENAKGSVFIISTDHDSGKQLEGLGGIAAILRYKLQ